MADLNTSCVKNTVNGDSYLQVDDISHEASAAGLAGAGTTASELNTSCVVNTVNGDSYLQVDDISHGASAAASGAGYPGPGGVVASATHCVMCTVNGDSYNQVDD